MTTVGLIEIDAGDSPSFTVGVSPYAGDTSMTASIQNDATAVSTPFPMTGSSDKSTWTGTGPSLATAGRYTATFTVTGTGAGVQFHTVIVAVPPPLTSDLRQIRLLIADTDPDNRVFRVDELQDFLDLEGSVKLAAAQALDVIATSEVLLSKVIRTQDLGVDGAKVSAELRARASGLRRQVAEGLGDDTVGLDIVDFIPPDSRTSDELSETAES